MAAEMAKQEDREQVRERGNALRIIGGLLLVVALLLYFFHQAETPWGHWTLGVLAGLFAASGAALLWVGWQRLRTLR
jgi:phosphatidylglycerophosphate synthase